MKSHTLNTTLDVLCRLIIAVTFLSAVADRFGLWGNFGDPQVSWGNFNAFLHMVEKLCFWAPKAAIPYLGWLATLLEIIFPILILFNIKVRFVALSSAILFFIFIVTMVLSGLAKSMIDHGPLCAMASALFIYYLNTPTTAHTIK